MFNRLSKIVTAAAVAVMVAGGVSAATLGYTTVVPVKTPNAKIDRTTAGSFGSGSATSVLPLGLDLSVKYPITAIASAGVFEHDGSQLVLDRIFPLGSSDTATVSNFVVDVPAFAVFADVAVNGNSIAKGFQLFDIVVPKLDVIADAGFVRLNYTEAFASAYNGLFEPLLFPVDKGDLFGYAKVELDVAPIPLPASTFLLVAGIGALGAVRLTARRRS